MTANDVLNFFKKLNFNNEAETEKFEYAKLEDGTIISSDKFEVGQPIAKILEDGTTEILPDGEYNITITEGEEDVNKKIVITNGVIETIEDATATEGDETEEPAVEVEVQAEEVEQELAMDPSMQAMMDEMMNKIAELEKRIGELEGSKPEEKTAEADTTVMEEVNLEKLDGAPIEEFTNVNIKKVVNSAQNTFLNKLYK